MLDSILMVLAFVLYIASGREIKDRSLIAAFATSLVFLLFFPDSINIVILFTGTLAVNSMYRKRSIGMLFLFTVDVILGTLLMPSDKTIIFECLSIGVGIAISLMFSTYMKGEVLNNEKERGNIHHTEIYRDLFQIAVGIAIITLMILSPHLIFEVIIIISAILAIFILDIASLYSNFRISRLIYKMERRNVKPGLGTLWFIAGLMLLISLSPRWRIAEIGVFAMAIGDSLATIGGLKIRIRRLFYNRKKSLGGFLFMLVPTSIFALILLGPSYFLIALIATFVESLSRYPLDDNVTIPSSVILGSLLLSVL